MPKTPSEDVIAISLRVSPDDAAWLQDLANRTGSSVNRICRRIVEDAKDLYGLPGPIVEALTADCKALDLDTFDLRDYVIHILTLRYRQIITEGASAAPIKRPTKR